MSCAALLLCVAAAGSPLLALHLVDFFADRRLRAYHAQQELASILDDLDAEFPAAPVPRLTSPGEDSY